MSDKLKKIFTPTAWLFYLIIGIEILYMISPFAIYYYSTYGPSLNFLHKSPATAWLTTFFLPHYVETSSVILNAAHATGEVLMFVGFAFFVIGAGQIYFYKFTKRGAVTGGIYRVIRHPQYVALAIMGLGLLLVWPRFTVLIMYMSMLFVYYWLARKEEKECEEKFGESYLAYKAATSMFIPGKLSFKFPTIPEAGVKRFAFGSALYLLVLGVSVGAGFGLRAYSVSMLAVHYSENSATISADFLSENEIASIEQIALADTEVQKQMHAANGGAITCLNYLVPLAWYLPDLPLEKIPEGFHGHHQPENYDRNLYKVLITKAKLTTDSLVNGADIIKKTFGRVPLLVAKVDRAKGEVTGIETPPPHVRWGDIPTPLF